MISIHDAMNCLHVPPPNPNLLPLTCLSSRLPSEIVLMSPIPYDSSQPQLQGAGSETNETFLRTDHQI